MEVEKPIRSLRLDDRIGVDKFYEFMLSTSEGCILCTVDVRAFKKAKFPKDLEDAIWRHLESSYQIELERKRIEEKEIEKAEALYDESLGGRPLG